MFKFRKIASVLASTFMIGSSVAIAAAANFPAPFVQSGSADVAVVWGSAAGAALDLAAVTNIADKLSSEYAKAGVSGSSSSISGGDNVLLAKSSDKLNLGNTVNGVFGSTVSKDHLPTLLADGTYNNDANDEYPFEQKITLGTLNLTAFADSDYNNKAPTVAVRVPSNTFIMNYTLDFTTDAESAVGSSGDLTDFETTTLTLLGKSYYVLDAQNGTSATNLGKFTLLDSATTATIKEGETKTVTFGGKSFEVSAVTSTSQVKLTINGEAIKALSAGSTYKLSDGTYIGIKDIFDEGVAGSVGSVDISLGKGKLELTTGSEVKLNDDTVSGVKSYIYGTMSSTKRRLDKIVIEWISDEKGFIAPDSELVMPGFSAIKFSMGSFVTPKQEITSVDYDGDNKIVLKMPLKDGDATIPLLFADSATGAFIGIGSDTDQRLATSGSSTLVYNQTVSSNPYHKYFVVTYNSTTSAQSYLLSLTVSKDDNGYNRTTIKNEITGKDVQTGRIATDTFNIGDASLTVAGVFATSTDKGVTLTAGTNTNFNTVYSAEGLKAWLPYITANTSVNYGAINFTYAGPVATNPGHNNATFIVSFAEEDKDGNLGSATYSPEGGLAIFNVTVGNTGASNYDVQASSVSTGRDNLQRVSGSDDTVSWVSSDLGTKVTKIVSASRGKAEIEYHGTQAYGEVFLAAPSAVVSGNSTGGSTLGSVSVKDSEVQSVNGKNLIVVGGSCVNTVAATLLGSSTPLCGADWTAKTGIGANQALIQVFASPYKTGKIATLVAGFNAPDTAMAGKYLTTQTVDTTVGKKYTVTSETAATVSGSA